MTARVLPVALAVSLLAAGCTGGAPAPGEASGTDSEGSSAHAEEGSADAATAAMPVGPLEIDAAQYWTPVQAEGDISRVAAGGCEADAPCPSFAVISGDTAAQIDASEPFFDDGIACPVLGTTPTEGTLLAEHPATVAGEDGTMHMFDVTCTDADGNEELTLPQNQWSLETESGTIVIVDRWSFDGLLTKVAEASLT
ncbi:hypothetical protein [Demequina flava]|uniref:hypothetical protein n=1 Tax=Demequina flava TaxID=1095025 RepID=UPI0007832E7B|nr:hypothetical protein [Demequina flava]